MYPNEPSRLRYVIIHIQVIHAHSKFMQTPIKSVLTNSHLCSRYYLQIASKSVHHSKPDKATFVNNDVGNKRSPISGVARHGPTRAWPGLRPAYNQHTLHTFSCNEHYIAPGAYKGIAHIQWSTPIFLKTSVSTNYVRTL